jgi:hypothetical protein
MIKLRFVIFGLCAFLPVITLHHYEGRLLASHSMKAKVTTQGAVIPPAVRSLRPNFPYSVVPGGVYSPDELRAATKNDPLVGQHYSDFNLQSARLVKLTEDVQQYASFRLGNRIFWTRNKLPIPKGEVLVTDGNSYARTRCGNRLSDAVMSDTTPLQPSDDVLSLPLLSSELIPPLRFTDAPRIPESPVLPFQPPQLGLFRRTTTALPLQTAANWPSLRAPRSVVSLSTAPHLTTPLIPIYPRGR